MGCDIHPVLEKKHKFEDGTERWVGLHDFPLMQRYTSVLMEGETNKWELACAGYNWQPAFDKRNYARFAALCGVRGDGPDPKGLPEDASDLTKFRLPESDGDLHSHSWTSLREALEICLKTEYDSENVFLNEKDPRRTNPLSYFFGLDWFDDDKNDTIDNYRVVYAFDN